MRIQVISKDNGVGLTHDFRVLKEAILLADPSAEVLFTDWKQARRGERFDINFHLELVGKDHMAQAPRNIYVPNPEWYYAHLWDRLMPRMSEVWAKTRDCESIFRAKHHRVEYSGWTSRDMHMPSAERIAGRVLHVAGDSDAKGTEAVLAAAVAMPFTAFTIISRRKRPMASVANINFLVDVSDEVLAEAMNAHRIHLCPSSYEGFGHYINEAKACEAVVITTNAPPMNELVTRDFGVGVAPSRLSYKNLGTHQHVSGMDLADAVSRVMAVSEGILSDLGRRARVDYVRRREAFHAFVDHQLKHK
jgi:glycosyltransferase involved in cell wall biosynthesis